MATDIDLHLGKRLRRRRRLMGLTQQQLADSVGIRFQQIQKYECGANRISASRLWQLAEALQSPVNYFYDGISSTQDATEDRGGGEVLARKETLDLIRAYYQLGERPAPPSARPRQVAARQRAAGLTRADGRGRA